MTWSDVLVLVSAAGNVTLVVALFITVKKMRHFKRRARFLKRLDTISRGVEEEELG